MKSGRIIVACGKTAGNFYFVVKLPKRLKKIQLITVNQCRKLKRAKTIKSFCSRRKKSILRFAKAQASEMAWRHTNGT